MLFKLNENEYMPFSTRNPTTGAVQNADALPVATVYQQGGLTPLLDSSVDTTYVEVLDLTATGQYTVRVLTNSGSGFVTGLTYSVRINATVAGVTDETQIGFFMVSTANHGQSIDAAIGSVPEGVWTYDFAGDSKLAGLVAWQLLAFSAIGAGIGQVDTGVPDPGSSRDETFAYPDGVTDAFVVTADAEGNRTTINLAP